MVDIVLIDEMRSQLPISAYPSLDLSKSLVSAGKNVQPDTELKIINVVESGNEGGIVCELETTDREIFVISLTLLRIKPGHPLAKKISAYQKRRIRSIFRSNGMNPRMLSSRR